MLWWEKQTSRAVLWHEPPQEGEVCKLAVCQPASLFTGKCSVLFLRPFNQGCCETILDQLYKGNAVFLDRLYFRQHVIFKDTAFFFKIMIARVIAKLSPSETQRFQARKRQTWFLTDVNIFKSTHCFCERDTWRDSLKATCLTEGPVPVWQKHPSLFHLAPTFRQQSAGTLEIYIWCLSKVSGSTVSLKSLTPLRMTRRATWKKLEA